MFGIKQGRQNGQDFLRAKLFSGFINSIPHHGRDNHPTMCPSLCRAFVPKSRRDSQNARWENQKTWWKDEKSQIGGEEEIKTATRDVKCKEKSNLVNTWFEAERRLEGQGVRENKEYFQSLAEAKERHMSAVKEVLSR
jgi:hypothetical protein